MSKETERIRLLISYKSKTFAFSVQKFQRLERLMCKVCSHFNELRSNAQFYYKKRQLKGYETAEDLNFTENDRIDVKITKLGIYLMKIYKIAGVRSKLQ